METLYLICQVSGGRGKSLEKDGSDELDHTFHDKGLIEGHFAPIGPERLRIAEVAEEREKI